MGVLGMKEQPAMRARYNRHLTGDTSSQRSGDAGYRPWRHWLGVAFLIALWATPPLMLLVGAWMVVPVYEDFGFALPALTVWLIDTASTLSGGALGSVGTFSSISPLALLYVAVYLGMASIFIVFAAVMRGRAGRTIARLGAIPPIFATIVCFAGWMLPLIAIFDSLG